MTNQLPNFKHGLNISLVPEFNFDFKALVPSKESKNSLSIVSSNSKVLVKRNYLSAQKEFSLINTNEPNLNNAVWSNHLLNVKDSNLIIIPANSSSEIDITLDLKDTNSLFSLYILAEKDSKSKITLFVKSDNSSIFVSELFRLIASENAQIEITSVHDLSKKTISFQDRHALGKSNSNIIFNDLFVGGKYTRSETINILSGPHSKTDNSLIYLSKNSQMQDFYVSSLHDAENTESNISVKGVLKDSAKALSRSLIKISPKGRFSKGYEKQEALLIGEKAEADAIPDLEIENNDVQCSHGSTIGKINEEQIFYLQSRGLSRTDALAILIEGYFSPIINKFSDKSFASRIKGVIYKHLNGN